MRATVEEYWNTAAILEYFQHPSRRAIQIFGVRDRKLILRNILKIFLRTTLKTSIRHERHFWMMLKMLIRRKRVNKGYPTTIAKVFGYSS